jgi:hypothetical protein
VTVEAGGSDIAEGVGSTAAGWQAKPVSESIRIERMRIELLIMRPPSGYGSYQTPDGVQNQYSRHYAGNSRSTIEA